jgi:hypothetical protein
MARDPPDDFGCNRALAFHLITDGLIRPRPRENECRGGGVKIAFCKDVPAVVAQMPVHNRRNSRLIGMMFRAIGADDRGDAAALAEWAGVIGDPFNRRTGSRNRRVWKLGRNGEALCVEAICPGLPHLDERGLVSAGIACDVEHGGGEPVAEQLVPQAPQKLPIAREPQAHRLIVG